MKKNQLILGLVVLAVVAALVVWGRDRIHFDFAEFRVQLAMVDWWRVAIGLVCIYVAGDALQNKGAAHYLVNVV